MTQPPVDPRFDPVFQRGYDPAQHGEPATSAPSPTYTAEPAAVSHRAPAAHAAAAADVAPVVEVELPGPPNPWLRVLLVVSLAMLVLAVLLFYLLATGPSGNGVNGRDALATVIQSLQYQAPPALLTAGFVGLALRLSLGLLLRRP